MAWVVAMKDHSSDPSDFTETITLRTKMNSMVAQEVACAPWSILSESTVASD